jgi:hypothetical protein
MQLCAQPVNLNKLKSSVLFSGDSVTAYRDPLPFYDKGIFYLYFTLTETEKDGRIYMYTAMSYSKNLTEWSPVKKITVKDQSLNFSSPGSIIRYNGEWIMCLQTYPRPGFTNVQVLKYGDATSRLFIMRSKNLQTWSTPELLYVKGDTVAEKNMGRMIDPFLLADKNEKGKWWIFYKQNGASRSYSYDLKHWTYSGHIPAGENVCIIWSGNEYIMFHSLENGIGVKYSANLVNWKDDPQLIRLGQDKWNWAKGRITAGFVLDMNKSNVTDYRYLLFFHGSGPKTEKQGDFDKNASIGLAWSNDMVHWLWR